MAMMQRALTLLFAALAAASPNPLVNRNGGVNCAAVNKIITIMHEQAVATPFCSSYLHISPVTSTSTVTSTPCAVTSTTTVKSTDTVTTTTFSTVSAVTTVYPVVAVSVTSTCALGATVIPSASGTSPSGYVKAKRGNTKCSTTTKPPPPPTSMPLGTPTCLTKFIQTDISSACSCLSIPTPTKVSVVTSTLSTSTVTKTIASSAYTTTTVTSTTTTFTSTYSGTQYYTSTFTILPPPSSTQAPAAAPTETFGVYPGLTFYGQDIQNFFCYANGPAPPAPFAGTTCQNFNDCLNECAYYNANNLGKGQTCGAVSYSAPPDGSSGSCYLKTGETGCGSPDSNVTSGVILPLVATDPQ